MKRKIHDYGACYRPAIGKGYSYVTDASWLSKSITGSPLKQMQREQSLTIGRKLSSILHYAGGQLVGANPTRRGYDGSWCFIR